MMADMKGAEGSRFRLGLVSTAPRCWSSCDVSGGSAVVIDSVGVMASFHALL